MRDPLYRAIEGRLAERPDPELFERCAVDLLRDAYPGLVPIRGGGDGGMDGAVSWSRGGHPLPLVVTTGNDVIGNLTRNLEVYGSKIGAATEVVLATSRALTPRKRRNLERRAGELGFVLRNIHDRADFVGRLYEHPAWRRDLLGLTGDPPALSAFPRSPRPWPTRRLLGRDEELTRLRRAERDVVISGQPGVGKTALLGTLAKEGHGLFVVLRDIGRIADACRELDPDRVFVDDAHLDAASPRDSLLGDLVRLRHELGMRFRIMATTWPGHESDIRRTLYLSTDQVLRVSPLERSVMAEIVRAVNSGFADGLIGEILDQSEGRPGLAVTLAQWVRRGELEDLVNGRLLLSELKADMTLSASTLDALAAFAMGGSAGMSLTGAASALGVTEWRLREGILPVAGTGIVHEIENEPSSIRALSVKPSALRHALVRRSFFSGVLSVPIEPVIEEVRDAVACTETLIGTLRRGAPVPHDLVRQRLEEHDDAGVGGRLWEHYAWTGRRAVDWVLGGHCGKTGLIAAAALEFAPGRAMDRMMPDVVEGGANADALTAHIRNWVLGGPPGAEAVERRRLLLGRIVDCADSIATGAIDSSATGGRESALARLFHAVFALHFESIRGDRVTKTGFTLDLGSVPGADVSELARCWPEALGVLRRMGFAGISCAREIVRRWIIGPKVLNARSETRTAARREVRAMLPDLIELAGSAPGMVLWARRLLARQGMRADLPRIDDPILARLFPGRGELQSEDRSARGIDGFARAFAVQWIDEGPGTVVARMLYYERQRALLDHHYPNVLTLVPNQLAQITASPEPWLEALVDLGAPPEWVVPFLDAAMATGTEPDAVLSIVARDPRLETAAVDFAVRVRGLSGEAVRRIMAAVPSCARSLADGRPWNDMPREWKRRLLGHRDPVVRGATAAGLWEVSDGRAPCGALGRLWRAAVVECGDADLLIEVLRSDSAVARAWTLHKARRSAGFNRDQADNDPPPSNLVSAREIKEFAVRIVDGMDRLDQLGIDDGLVRAARNRMTIEDRRELILAIPPDADPVFFRHLVGSKPELYAALLGRPVSREAHLAPLRGDRPEILVRMARKHGYAASEI